MTTFVPREELAAEKALLVAEIEDAFGRFAERLNAPSPLGLYTESFINLVDEVTVFRMGVLPAEPMDNGGIESEGLVAA